MNEENLPDSSFWSEYMSWLPKFWGYELTKIDQQPIYLSTLIIGIVLLILGYFICRSVAREVEKRVLSRMDIDQSVRFTLRTIIFYFMLVFLVLFVFSILNIPLEVFTVLGGALAIGVGFGSQNIVNNFISGLIIMIERPVRVGDIINVGGLHGTVENIGARSTRVKSFDNTHIVVPNSSFLEQNVLNLTLSDSVIRTSIKVGVAYGSPTRRVKELLLEAVGTQSQVLKYPEPVVLFQDFGDNALGFEVFFWTRVSNFMQMRLLQSEMRFTVDALFRENNISISFPQRDVHLDTLKPLEVRLTHGEKSIDQ